MEDILEYIKSKTENLDDICYRELELEGEVFNFVFCDTLINKEALSNFVIKSIIECIKEDKEESDLKSKLIEKLSLKEVELQNIVSINNIKKIEVSKENIFDFLMSGYVVIICSTEVYVIETKASLERSIGEPANETSIRGSKDSFVENISKNIGLVRIRIKTEKLEYKENKIGRRTKTKVALMYINDIAKLELVKYVEEKLQKIDIDGILDVNYIQEFIEDKNDSDFPVSIITQRPDLVAYYLLQGRITVFVDNSPYVLILPAFFEDFINNVDDLYQKSKNVTLTKIIRYLALVITITIPALYLSLITFDQESIPTDLLKAFAIQREGVPFPAFLEAFMMIFAFEILKESDMRSNKMSGNTLSIVGALILGEAAVSAGIVSPIMIIVVAVTTITGLTFSDINIINTLRKWRIIFMIFASFSGIIGMGIAFALFVTSLVSTKSYTKPFTYPVSPLDMTEVKENLFTRIKISKDKKRKKILTNNLTKSR